MAKQKLPEGVDEIVRLLMGRHDADIFAYSGSLQQPYDDKFRRLVRKTKSRPNAYLMLATAGGSAASAYRMGRCLQQCYPDGKILMHIDLFCKSAGTLLAIAAHELIMADRAELGPVDVQRWKPDEIGEQYSGLTPVQALEFLQEKAFELFEDHFLKLWSRSGRQITTKTAAHIATELAVGLFRPVYEQLDPLRLGEDYRAMQIGHWYGQRLGGHNLKNDGLERLVADYPSHDFVIDRREASNLFRNVRAPSDIENRLANCLLVDAVMDAVRGGIPVVLPLKPDDNVSGEPRDGEEETPNETENGRERSATTQQVLEGKEPSGSSTARSTERVTGDGPITRTTVEGASDPPG